MNLEMLGFIIPNSLKCVPTYVHICWLPRAYVSMPFHVYVGLKDKIGNGDRVSTDTKRPPELHVVGRCILNLWRLLRHEVSWLYHHCCGIVCTFVCKYGLIIVGILHVHIL